MRYLKILEGAGCNPNAITLKLTTKMLISKQHTDGEVVYGLFRWRSSGPGYLWDVRSFLVAGPPNIYNIPESSQITRVTRLSDVGLAAKN